MYGKWWNIGHLKMNFVVVYLGSYKCEFSDFRGGVFRVGVFWVVVPCVVRGGAAFRGSLLPPSSGWNEMKVEAT